VGRGLWGGNVREKKDSSSLDEYRECDGSGISRLIGASPKVENALAHPTYRYIRHTAARVGLESTQQGLLSPLAHPSPFPWLLVRRMAIRDSGNLIVPFMHVNN